MSLPFECDGFSELPREPELLTLDDQALLAEMLEKRARETGSPCRLTGTIAQCERTAMLVDTGAMCSIMSRAFYEKLRSQKSSLRLWRTSRKLHGITGNTLECGGVVSLDVEVEGRFALVQFAVTDLALGDDVILGMDFLRQSCARWDFDKSEITFRVTEPALDLRQVQTSTSRASLATNHRVYLAERAIVHARSEAVMLVKVRARGPLPQEGLVLPVRHTVAKYGVMAAHASLTRMTRLRRT